MKERKEHTVFYFNAEVDQALRECDDRRAKERLQRQTEQACQKDAVS